MHRMHVSEGHQNKYTSTSKYIRHPPFESFDLSAALFDNKSRNFPIEQFIVQWGMTIPPSDRAAFFKRGT